MDDLNSVGVLKRREIEARILAPLLQAMSQEFGQDRVMQIARQTIVQIAQEQGAALSQEMGGNSLAHFEQSLENWKKDEAMQIEVLQQDEQHFYFNVHRCRYAEMYRSLGIAQLGELLSCNRDGSLIQGFNPDIELERTQTLMQGAAYCNFRYRRKT